MGDTPIKWNKTVRYVDENADLHPTVYERLKLPSVRNFDSYAPYRPEPLRKHAKAKEFFTSLKSPVQS
jgi:hypothetical protein